MICALIGRFTVATGFGHQGGREAPPYPDWATALKDKSMRIIRWIACVSGLSAVLMRDHFSTTAQTADLHNLDAFIARALQEYQVPGAAIAVVQDGKVVMARGYGVRDVTKPGVVDEHTIFNSHR